MKTRFSVPRMFIIVIFLTGAFAIILNIWYMQNVAANILPVLHQIPGNLIIQKRIKLRMFLLQIHLSQPQLIRRNQRIQHLSFHKLYVRVPYHCSQIVLHPHSPQADRRHFPGF
jgi:hypothetical protein